MLVCRSWPGRGARMRSTSSMVRPQAVLDHALRAGLAAQPLVEGELEAFLADVVDACEAEQVAGDFARRVVAPVLAQQVHARDTERRGRARRRSDACGARDRRTRDRGLLVTRRASHCGSRSSAFGEPREFLRRLRELGGVRPDRVDRRAHRERLAVAVEDHAAIGRELRDAREARIALLLEEALVDHLQVDRARDQHAGRERKQREQRAARASAPVPRPPPSCDRCIMAGRCAGPRRAESAS